MSSTHILWVCLLLIIQSVQSRVNSTCRGKLNTNEILREEPRFVNSVPNGKHFLVGQGYDKINIVHVYGGTPYDMGLALGQLMSKELNELIPEYFAYLDTKIEDVLKTLPPVSMKISFVI
jgi:hypothetical protein